MHTCGEKVMEGPGYGSVVVSRSLRSGSAPFHERLDQESRELLLSRPSATNLMQGTDKESVLSIYITNLKSRFFTLGLVVGGSLQMFFVSIILMVYLKNRSFELQF